MVVYNDKEYVFAVFFFFSSRRRHTRCSRDWSSDVCSSDLDEWLYPSLNHGTVVKLSAAGEPLESYWDPGGASHATITSMREHDGWLYIGGLMNNRIGRIRLAPAASICDCGQRPCAARAEMPAARAS